MRKPPIGKAEFYARRDDRQRRLAAGDDYQSARTALVADKRTVRTREGQIALLTGANLLARWSRTVDLAFPDAELDSQLVRGDHVPLRACVLTEMKRADPFGDFGFREPQAGALVLQIGPTRGSSQRLPALAVWAQGWEALGWAPGREAEPRADSDSPLFVPGLLLAVCLGVAQLFKQAVRQDPKEYMEGFRWCLWEHKRQPITEFPSTDLPRIPVGSETSLGRLLQVGAGAVGSNVLYVLDLLGVAADITLVDYDSLELENLDRSLLFGLRDAVPTELPKVEAAAAGVTAPDLSVTPFKGTWDDFVEKELGTQRFDLWLPLANEFGVRRSMAANLPPLMVHGSTSRDWEIYVGRHIPLRDYCLHCRFPTEGAEPTFPCSEGKPATSLEQEDAETEKQMDPSLPFLSAAAAALASGELLKLGVDGYKFQPNYVAANLHGSMSGIVALAHPRYVDCPTCTNPPKDAWWARNSDTRYSFLSRQAAE